jgi:hypothetical protein
MENEYEKNMSSIYQENFFFFKKKNCFLVAGKICIGCSLMSSSLPHTIQEMLNMVIFNMGFAN